MTDDNKVVLLESRRIRRQQDACRQFGVTPYELARDALNPDLTTDMRDPRNAKYLVPLPDGDEHSDEAAAEEMASIVYNSILDLHTEGPNFDQFFDADGVYQQCLVDARRMLRDRDYWHLYSWSSSVRGGWPLARVILQETQERPPC
jgi:hypothetical protein